MWFEQMEYYFELVGLDEMRLVKGGFTHFDSKHWSEIRNYKDYSYPRFKKKMIHLFESADLSQAVLEELIGMKKESEETLTDFMTHTSTLQTVHSLNSETTTSSQ